MTHREAQHARCRRGSPPDDRVSLVGAVESVPATALRASGRDRVRGRRGRVLLAAMAVGIPCERGDPPFSLARGPLSARTRPCFAAAPPVAGQARALRDPPGRRKAPRLSTRVDHSPGPSARVLRPSARPSRGSAPRACLPPADRARPLDGEARVRGAAEACGRHRRRASRLVYRRLSRRPLARRGAERARPAGGQLRVPLLRRAARLQGDRRAPRGLRIDVTPERETRRCGQSEDPGRRLDRPCGVG